jgi:hypothetical protein
MIRERYFYVFKSNICYWAGAIKFCYVKLSSDSGKQVKKFFAKPAPSQQSRLWNHRRNWKKESLALSKEVCPWLPAPQKDKKKEKLQDHKGDFTTFHLSQHSFPVVFEQVFV